MIGARTRNKLGRCLIYLLLTVFAVLLVGPYLWLVSSSLKHAKDIYTQGFHLIPRDLDTNRIYVTFSNYRAAITKVRFLQAFANTILIASINTLANLILNALAGYGFARLRFPGREIIFRLCLATMMIPSTVLLIPELYIVRQLGLYNTHGALIFPFLMSVYNVFMMRQFLLNIPRDLEESAKIDGAGYFAIFWRVALPLCRPVLVTLGVFTFLWNYNNFIWPLIMLIDQSKYTMPLALAMLVTESQVNYPVLLASSVIMSLPLILIFIGLQRHFTDGITLGAMKQ
ncbi:MAG: carbohydrate ABC transporter permease [Bacteroidota bacterium]